MPRNGTLSIEQFCRGILGLTDRGEIKQENENEMEMKMKQ
jgi:hypothetical protein